MSKHLLLITLFLAAFDHFPIAVGQNIEVSELLTQIEDGMSDWPEGAMSCVVTTPYKDYSVDAYWAGTDYRLEYRSVLHENQLSSARWELKVGTRRLIYNSDSDYATILSVAQRPETSFLLRVFPNQVWQEINHNMSTKRWLSSRPSSTSLAISRTPDGFEVQANDPSESGSFQIWFTNRGHLRGFKNVDLPPSAPAIECNIEWSESNGTPAPKLYSRMMKGEDQDDILEHLRIEVTKFSDRVPKQKLPVDVVPEDLPIGTYIKDRTNPASPRSFFAQGEEGKLQFQLNRAADKLIENSRETEATLK